VDTTTPEPAETRLPGGGMGGAVRAGGTVRRAAGPWTPTVQHLLAHLRAAGVAGVPAPLGVDDRGRDVTEHVPGDVPRYPLPAWVWRDEVLADAAALLRRVHDASASFDRSGAVWRLPPREPAEVVCHSDTSPDNMVFRDGRLVALIDWDTAAPGPRTWDLAYLAYRLVPLGPAGADPGPLPVPERRRRAWTCSACPTAACARATSSPPSRSGCASWPGSPGSAPAATPGCSGTSGCTSTTRRGWRPGLPRSVRSRVPAERRGPRPRARDRRDRGARHGIRRRRAALPPS